MAIKVHLFCAVSMLHNKGRPESVEGNLHFGVLMPVIVSETCRRDNGGIMSFSLPSTYSLKSSVSIYVLFLLLNQVLK
jgi:hypothetical protein